jgi:HTH-type transcriptional regulator, transcriptional repressor of NAD biosynthesis genes
MTHGLVIGKFMPIHYGHIALIQFAAQQCDEVIVSMSVAPDDAIDPQLRFEWIKEIFKHEPSVKPAMIADDFDDLTLPLGQRTAGWAKVMRKVYPTIDCVFSSEPYGEPFAQHLNAKHILFDSDRKKFPVAASLIRKTPFTYWNFIPEIVKPFFVKKICFYGPESTGKSVMAKKMAEQYQTEFVPEVARELITSNEFSVEDIIRIGYAQLERVQKKLNTANKFLFCDTDTVTTEIYSNYYLQTIPAVLVELEKKITYDLYFLFDIDVPWVQDQIRDLGSVEKRKEMYRIFKNALDIRNISYINVRGTWSERERIITEALNKFL